MTMESSSTFLLCSAIFLSAALYLYLLARGKHKGGSQPPPPGPPGWPVVGNMFDLGSMPHKTLAGLRRMYGPVVSLRLGSMKTLVIMSAEAATELFKNHDLSFVGRNINDAMRACCYNEGSMALGQYGPYWRALRRLCATQLFVNRRLNETTSIRKKCTDGMVKWIAEEASKNSSVDVAHFVFLAVFNLVGNLSFSCNLLDPESKEGAEFFHLNSVCASLSGQPNVADFFPFLKWLDPQGIRRKMEKNLQRLMNIAGNFVEEHIRNQSLHKETEEKDLLDVLLEFRGNGKDERAQISKRDLKILILVRNPFSYDPSPTKFPLLFDVSNNMFGAGNILGCYRHNNHYTRMAMAELLRSPGSLRKVQEELDQVVGQSRSFEERHIGQLPYLAAVIRETLRLHPPLPFLIPRKTVKDTEFMGYSIDKDTQVFVHAWAIGRDPAYYDDPLVFKPERFLKTDVDYRGHHFQFIPFGAGRRMCAGLPLADRMLHLLLGSLLHSFDWALHGNIAPEMIDMTERMGIVLRRAKPLNVIPKLRLKNVIM